MYSGSTHVQTNQKIDYGKCLCVSIPFHEFKLTEDMYILSHMQLCSTRSQYLRNLIKSDRRKVKEQYGLIGKLYLDKNKGNY